MEGVRCSGRSSLSQCRKVFDATLHKPANHVGRSFRPSLSKLGFVSLLYPLCGRLSSSRPTL
jgi:hypothetical protein